MNPPDLSIVVPVFNEAHRIRDVVSGLVQVCREHAYDYHILILNDGSTDWSGELEASLKKLSERIDIQHFTVNRGKGSVLNAVFPSLSSTWTVIIDADNEYAASDIPAVVAKLQEGDDAWVLGARYGFSRRRPKQYALTYLANKLLNGVFVALSGARIHDFLTGLYGFRSDTVRDIELDNRRFAYMPELLWKVIRTKGVTLGEVPIDYAFRTYAEGKTIQWWEFFTILFAILKFSRTRRVC